MFSFLPTTKDSAMVHTLNGDLEDWLAKVEQNDYSLLSLILEYSGEHGFTLTH